MLKSHWLLLPPIAVALLILPTAVVVQGQPPETRQTIDLTSDWRFHLGDVPEAALPEFVDTAWRVLDLPHDWSFEEGVSPDGAQGPSGGYYPGGIGWYRNTFDCPDLKGDQEVIVEFDGVYMNSDVWINGRKLGRFPYGYLSFSYNLTPFLQRGKNTLVVRCDNSLEPSARWYHPCGIYAPVRLVRRGKAHVRNVFVTTPHVTARQATVRVESELVAAGDCSVEYTILAPDGSETVSTAGNTLIVNNPELWSCESPRLYTLATKLVKGGKVVDSLQTRFGIRTIRWEPQTGFWLNDKNVKLLGVCEHYEAGPVGGAWTPELLRWKLSTLRSMGCNSIRTAHNPCPPLFYELCDELGILVMDEIFDGWKRKAQHDYGQQAFAQRWETDLRAWLKRDRNHPSIIIWSVGNETRGPVAPDLVRVCHELDPTRPVTSGHSGSEHMDVYGINGGSERRRFYTGNHRPTDKPFVATEAPHTWQVRGYYRSKTWYRDGFPNKRADPFPIKDLTAKEIFAYDWADPASKPNPAKQVFNSSYDNATVRITARKNWELMRDLPWYSGHFRWTGFDYPGEAGYIHGGYPFRAFMGGTHDLAGFPKDLAYFYQSQWTDKPMVHLLPHWTHPKMEPGVEIPVWAYSNAEEVELYLNDQSLGVRRPGRQADQMQCQWLVPWQPGTLLAIARTGGVEVARTTKTTAGPPAQLRLELRQLESGTRIMTTSLVDKSGTLAPYADNRVHFYLPAGARLYAHENGNPVDTENGVTGTSRRGFMGLVRSFLQVDPASSSSVATVAAVLGSRNGVTENSDTPMVCIDVQSLSLAGSHGEVPSAVCTVYFTTDGTAPSTDSPVYERPFTVDLPTTVRALVVRDGESLFQMEELFSVDAGLHWGEPNKQQVFAGGGGAQAENAELLGSARVAADGSGYRGKGYVDLSHQGDGIAWYQENDGTAGQFVLSFRYAQQDRTGKRSAVLMINGAKVKTLVFNNTGSWDKDWKTLETRVELNAGANEIVLKTDSGGGPRIDQLIVE